MGSFLLFGSPHQISKQSQAFCFSFDFICLFNGSVKMLSTCVNLLQYIVTSNVQHQIIIIISLILAWIYMNLYNILSLSQGLTEYEATRLHTAGKEWHPLRQQKPVLPRCLPLTPWHDSDSRVIKRRHVNPGQAFMFFDCKYTWIWLYVHLRMCIGTYVCTYICTHGCTYRYIYIYMYKYIHHNWLYISQTWL